MSATNYAEKAYGDHVLNIATYTAPTSYTFALFTTAPDDAGSGGVEVTGGSYARVSMNNTISGTTWATATGTGVKKNAADINFGTASADWGAIVAVGLYDNSGNLVNVQALTTSQTVNNLDSFKIEAEMYVMTLTFATTYLSNAMANLIFGAVAFTPAATLYARLYTASPGAGGGGTEVSTSSTAYAPVTVVNGATSWNAVTSGVGTTTNKLAFTFPKATASWGTVVAIALVDISGNFYFYAALTSVAIATNNSYVVAIGNFTATFA